jgi:Family of unknown function (DUF5683)
MFRTLKLYLIIFLISSALAQAQTSALYTQPPTGNVSREKTSADSLKHRPHSPRAAMLFSACVPGLGQAYNKKYWKIPLVYASLGSTLYFFKYNNKFYKEFKQAYINKIDTSINTVDLYPKNDASWLLEQEKSFRKYRDLNVILATLFYTLNIVDAYVDAQLMDFDVSDNLSLNIAPALNFYAANTATGAPKTKPSAGLTFIFKF